ncbi:MAG: hypothetical protein AAB362_00225 [Patescibacteria group bacterium]
MSEEYTTDLSERVNAVLRSVRKQQDQAADQLTAAEVSADSEKMRMLEAAAKQGDSGARALLKQIGELAQGAKKNVFAVHAKSVKNLMNVILDGKVPYVQAILNGVKINSLREADRHEKGKRVFFFDFSKKNLRHFVSVGSIAEDDDLVDELHAYRKREYVRIMAGLKDGMIAVEVAARLGVELSYANVMDGREANHNRAITKKLYFEGFALVPFPMRNGDPSSNKESLDLYNALLEAKNLERDVVSGEVSGFLLSPDLVKDTGDFLAVLAGRPGTVVMTETWKSLTVGVEMVRKGWADRLFITRISYRPFAESAFSYINQDQVKVMGPVPVKIVYHGSGKCSFEVRNFQLRSFFERRFAAYATKVVATDINTLFEDTRRERNQVFSDARLRISKGATLGIAEFWAKKPGRVPILVDGWKIGSEEVGFLDALLESDGKTIRVVEVSPMAAVLIFHDSAECGKTGDSDFDEVPSEFLFGEVPKRVHAWMRQAKNAQPRGGRRF